MEFRKYLTPNTAVAALIVLYLLVGLAIVPDYGMNWDYWPEQDHSYYNLAYMLNNTLWRPEPYEAPYDLNYYGPAFITPIQYINVKLQAVWPGLETLRVFYTLHFTSFLAGIGFFYLLAKRLMRPWTAAVATLLFATQPIYFGHAFINYKDTPFMVFFIASITAGLYMVDAVAQRWGEEASEKGQEVSWKGLIQSFTKGNLNPLSKQGITTWVHPALVLAAVMVGLTTSIRVLGPAAAGLVLLYALVKLGSKAIPMSLGYVFWAALTTYLTWPYLWSTKLSGFIESLMVMANFHWRGTVLFNGILYPQGTLPRSYLPTLLAAQFTEPAIVLAVIGVGAAVFLRKWERVKQFEILLIASWFIIPLVLAIWVNPVMYDNFRQFLFITPPLFILAGLGLETVFERIGRPKLDALLAVLALIPGVFALVHLHPYQYSYYNQFVGGVDGAFRRYELDYWITSFQDAMGFINRTAEPNAQVLVWGPIRIAKYYAREDLVMIDQRDIGQTPLESYDYALIHTRLNADEKNATQAETIYKVQIGEAVFAVVRKFP